MMFVTTLYALPLALLVIVLAARVALLRRRHHVGIGTGDNPELARAVRVHANAVEIIPLALVLMLLAELAGVWPAMLHVAGALFVVARVWHAHGLSGSPGVSPGRFYGTAISWLVIVALAFAALAAGVS